MSAFKRLSSEVMRWRISLQTGCGARVGAGARRGGGADGVCGVVVMLRLVYWFGCGRFWMRLATWYGLDTGDGMGRAMMRESP